MEHVVLVIHLILTVAMIVLILLQRSEGGGLGIGGSGGGGGLGSFASAQSTANALTKATTFVAICFFTTSMVLGIMASRSGGERSSILDSVGNPPAALTAQHACINASCGRVVSGGCGTACKTFVMSEIEIGFSTIIRDEYFAMLERTHGARIDVKIRVQLAQADCIAASLQQRPKRSGGQAFS